MSIADLYMVGLAGISATDDIADTARPNKRQRIDDGNES
jgi:hypothetical protein